MIMFKMDFKETFFKKSLLILICTISKKIYILWINNLIILSSTWESCKLLRDKSINCQSGLFHGHL